MNIFQELEGLKGELPATGGAMCEKLLHEIIDKIQDSEIYVRKLWGQKISG